MTVDPGGGGNAIQPRLCDIKWNIAPKDGAYPNGLIKKSGTNANHQYATNYTMGYIRNMGATWAGASNVSIRAGDISLKNGVNTPDHKEHEKGYQFDIGLFRLDGTNAGVTYKDKKQYDQATTQALVTQLLADPNVTKIIFNDPKIIGSKISRDSNGGSTHDNHLHVEFSNPCP